MKILLFYILLLFLCAVGLSCTSSKKIKTSKISTIDSASSLKTDVKVKDAIDSTSLKKSIKTESKESESNFDKKTIIDFSPEFEEDEKNGVQTPIDKDYFLNPKDAIKQLNDTVVVRGKSLISIRNKSKVIFKANGDIELNQTPKSISIEEKGNTKTKESKTEDNFDSTQLKGTHDSLAQAEKITELKKKEVEAALNKHKVSYWGWLWLGLGLAAIYFIGWYFGWWRFIFAFIKRTRKKDDNGRAV